LICAASHRLYDPNVSMRKQIARDAVRTDAIGVLTLNARLGFLAGAGVVFSATGKQASHTQSKSRSRLNALKHGIFASQAVLTAIEGREERAAFEQLLDGLAQDFAPVGTFRAGAGLADRRISCGVSAACCGSKIAPPSRRARTAPIAR
jgi:hypothetical protein